MRREESGGLLFFKNFFLEGHVFEKQSFFSAVYDVEFFFPLDFFWIFSFSFSGRRGGMGHQERYAERMRGRPRP